MSEIQIEKIDVASTERRLIAFGIDQCLGLFFYLPVGMQIGFSMFLNTGWELELKWLLASALVHFAYDVLFLYFLGATFGKWMMGLRVVASKNAADLTLFQAILRPLADRLSLFFGNGLRALAFLRYDRTHVSDWVAETRVVQAGERLRVVKRRKILGVVLFLFLSCGAFAEFYQQAQGLSYLDGKIVFDPTFGLSNSVQRSK